MSIGDRTTRTVVALLMSAAALSLTAAAFAASGGVGASHDAAPEGSLGLGPIRTAPPFALTAAEKIGTTEQMSGDHVPALVSVRPRVMTAIPAPKPAARTSRTARAVAVPAGGWHTARVTWYGPGFYGRHMASGLILREDSMVCAHKTLPFGTRIEFSYRGRTCVATVQDRGPYSRGLEFDLAGAVAKYLRFSGADYVRWRYVK